MGVFGLNRAKHQYIVGVGLTVVGVLGVIGSATGTLAPMLASLFAPQYVTPTQSTGSSATSGVVKDLSTGLTSAGSTVLSNSGGILDAGASAITGLLGKL